jgi:hypothetical protein
MARVLWKTRKTEVHLETWEETILRGVDRRLVGRCRRCLGESLMVTPEKMHQALGIGVREVWRAVDSGGVHFVETERGDLLVCMGSIKNWLHARGLLPQGSGTAGDTARNQQAQMNGKEGER